MWQVSAFIAAVTSHFSTRKWQGLMFGPCYFIFLLCLCLLFLSSHLLLMHPWKRWWEDNFFVQECIGLRAHFWRNTKRSHVENIIDFVHQCQTNMNSTIQKPSQNAGGTESLSEKFIALGFFIVIVVAGFVLYFFPFGFQFVWYFSFCSQESLVTSSLPLLRVYCNTLEITHSHVFYSIFDFTINVFHSWL